MTICTTLLDARLLTGDGELLQHAADAFLGDVVLARRSSSSPPS